MWTLMETPVGELRIVESGGVLTRVDFAPYHPPADGRPVGDRDDEHPVLGRAREQLRDYFDGVRRDFDLPLDPAGTAFQQRVWRELRLVPWGETVSYGSLAQRLGMTSAASRAVGMANGRNPIAIIIPCHRVIGANGKLVGYAYGLERKRRLLDLESGALF